MKYNLIHEEFDFATHQPVLIKALELSDGPVLELGCGEGSTKLIHETCKKRNRKVVSVETQKEWLDKYDKVFSDEFHQYILIDENDYFKTIDELCNQNWGLVLIDQNGWKNRSYSFQTLKNCSDYLVLHDCEQAALQGKLVEEIRPFMSKYDVGYRSWNNVIKYSKEFHPNKLMCWAFTRMVGPSILLASEKYECRNVQVDFSIKEIEI